MNNLLLVMGASGLQGTMRDYIRQLSRAGIETVIDDCSSCPTLHAGGQIGFKIASLRRLARLYSDYAYLVCSDAFDVTFYGHSRYAVTSRMPVDDRVLLAAEKNCYPDQDIAARIPANGPWRFVNGGLSAGSPSAYLALCDSMERHPLYRPDMLDQQFLNMMLAENSGLFCLDHRTRLFFCLFGGYDELQFMRGDPVNTMYDTWPLFVHANGQWTADAMLDRWRKSLQE